MTYTNYDIKDYFSSWLIEKYYTLLSVTFSVVKRSNFLPSFKRTGIIARINSQLMEVYIKSEGLKNVVKEFNQEQALRQQDNIHKIFLRSRTIHGILERAEFFNNPNTQEISENILTNLYEADSIVRNTAFSDDTTSPQDNQLLEFASNLSLSSLPD